MKQSYLADKFKNRILVGIKLSQNLVILLLALIKLRLRLRGLKYFLARPK